MKWCEYKQKAKGYQAIFVIAFCLSCLHVSSQLSLPKIFANNMILQREKMLPVWGRSSAGETITVSFHGQLVSAKANNDGNWQLLLNPEKAGGPYRLKVSIAGKDSIIYNNVLVGDVWVCAGQSNMNFVLSSDQNGKSELANLQNENIREYRCAMPDGALNPENKFHSEWHSTNGEAAGLFSAVGYYFAKELQAKESIAIGIIVMSCGNTRAESWTDTAALSQYDALKPLRHYWNKNEDGLLNHKPGAFYTTVVKPVIPFAVKGIVWYQGESNTLPDNSGRTIANRAGEYKTLLKALIRNWRKAWNNERLPFYIVQLPAYKDKVDLHWAEIRQAQLTIANELPHTGLAVTIDVGDSLNLHPDNKQPVGERLARLALAHEYHHANVVASGPLVTSIKVRDSKAILTFKYSGKKLVSKTGKNLAGFEITDRTDTLRFLKADAVISQNKIIVSSRLVKHPAAVRYAWSDDPVVSLFNDEGLPASPFKISCRD